MKFSDILFFTHPAGEDVKHTQALLLDARNEVVASVTNGPGYWDNNQDQPFSFMDEEGRVHEPINSTEVEELMANTHAVTSMPEVEFKRRWN